MPAAFDPIGVLRALAAHDVEYIVIGGFAAWMHGAAVVTTDLDLVYERSQENAERLTAALTDLQAIYRHQLGRRIEPNPPGFLATSGGGHHLFETTAGDVDALRSSGALGFEELLPRAVVYEVDGIEVRFASLEDVIEMKTLADRDKDRAALPLLRAALQEQERE